MPDSARILIVTNGHLCRNPRVCKEATYLGTAGYDVTVLGVCNHASSETIDASLRAGAPFRHISINLQPGASPAAFGRRLALRLWRDAATRLDWKTIHSLGPAASLLARARAVPANLTIVHNEIAHWVGLRLIADGRRVAADIEDWHSEDLLPADRVGRPLAVLRAIERDLLHRCAYTTTTSHALADALHGRYGGVKPHVITNSFPLQSNLRLRHPGDPAPASFFWFSQTLGPGRGLEAFLPVWSRLRTPGRLVLLGEDRASFFPQLVAQAAPELRPKIESRPLLPPDELSDEIARHDVGLALEDRSILSRDLTITNKILQYLNAGLAVAASDTAGQREVLAHSPRAGVIVPLADPAAAARLLDDLVADRETLIARQTAARRLAEDVYCWEREAPRLLALVNTALQRSLSP
jgi:glycosyltransferase involved in cell wall biosynthesis